MSRKLLNWVTILFTLTSVAATADEAVDKIRGRMTTLFPKEKVTEIRAAPVAGLYEVMIGASLFYVSADGRYFLRGDIIDLDARENLSDARRATARAQTLATLDPATWIEFPATAATARKVLYVFTDIDCGYCRKMHNEIKALNAGGVTVRYLAFPRAGVDSPSGDKAIAVWCAPNRREALTAAKRDEPVATAKCDNPVEQEFELGKSMGVTGTPAVYTDKGVEIGGYMPAAELVKMVDDGKI